MPIHKDILQDLTQMNLSFLPILDYLICYKSELGLSLQRMIENYNMLLLNQFEGYYKNENAKEILLNNKEQHLDLRKQTIDMNKHELYT